MTLFPQGYIGRVAQHIQQHLLSHMTPPPPLFLIEEKYINPAYIVALKAAFIIRQNLHKRQSLARLKVTNTTLHHSTYNVRQAADNAPK